MAAKRLCILGGNGFVGQHLCRALSRRGWQIRVPSRRSGTSSIPGVELISADIHNPDRLSELMIDCDAIINLVGILNERGSDGSGFKHAHVELTKKIIQACKQTGVSRLLHMSALHADAAHGPSYYLSTKGEAEELLVQAENDGLQVTRFCPSVIFGPGDSFFNRFAQLLRFAPVFPLACPEARFAPVYVGDVVNAFVVSLSEPQTIDQRYELCGPEIFSLRELVEYTARTCGYKRLVIGLNNTLSYLQASLLEVVPGKPMSRDNYRSLSVNSICEQGFPGLFGTPVPINEIVPDYLAPRSSNGSAG